MFCWIDSFIEDCYCKMCQKIEVVTLQKDKGWVFDMKVSRCIFKYQHQKLFFYLMEPLKTLLSFIKIHWSLRIFSNLKCSCVNFPAARSCWATAAPAEGDTFPDPHNAPGIGVTVEAGLGLARELPRDEEEGEDDEKGGEPNINTVGMFAVSCRVWQGVYCH